MAPAGTPPEIVARLKQALDAIRREPDMRAWMVQQGFDTARGSPDDFNRTLRADFVKWRETMRRLRLRSE
jgi:tripartite-type tricarboxylate transporter receptor subunit TctC